MTDIRKAGDGHAIRVGGVPEHFNLPWHQLSDERPDLISWRDVPGGTGALVELLDSGDLEVATLLTEGAVAGIARGLAAEVLALWVATPLQWGVHVAAESDFVALDQLQGRRIAISRKGSGSQLMAWVQAGEQGWTLDPEQFVEVGGLDGALEALPGGTADQFLWDRFMTNPHVASGVFRRVGVQPTPWPSFVVVATHDAMARRRLDVQSAIDAAFDRAADLTGHHDVSAIVADRYGLSLETAAEWWAVTHWATGRESTRDLEELTRSTRALLVDYGILEA